MANVPVRDSDGNKVYMNGTGTGTDIDPYIPANNVTVAAALPAGDNNVGNVDLASAIPAGTNTIGKVDLTPDLVVGTKSLLLTMSTGAGQAPIPNTAKIIGVKPTSTTMRVGFEALEANGTATGTALAADFKKGCPVDSGQYTWFNVGTGTDRVLYVIGGTSDTIEIVYM